MKFAKSKSKTIYKYQNGFTITEVIVAIAVFTIGVLSVVNVFVVHKRLSRVSENATIATYLAQEQIESILSNSYEDIVPGLYEARAPVEMNGDFAIFERQTEVLLVDENYNAVAIDQGLKKLVTTVFWPEKNTPKSESLATVITDF